MDGTLTDVGDGVNGGGGSLSPLLIFSIVLSIQLVDEFLAIIKKRASKSSEQAQLKEEIKQLLKEASSLSTPSTFAQAAKLRRVAAAKEKELLKRKEEIKEKNRGSHTMYARSVLVLKVLLYLVLCWSYWSTPVAAVPHHLLQPFGKFLSWKSKDSTGIITVGIIPWLALTSRVSKVICQKLLKVAIPK